VKILISGGFGFLGSHLVKRFSQDHDVIVYGNKLRNSLRYFSQEINSKNVTLINGDIEDASKLNHALRDDVDIVIHCAAICGVSNYFKKPVDTIVANGIGTFNVVDLCYKNRIPKTIILSSSEIYGDSESLNEIDGSTKFSSVHNLRLTYAISKLFGDQLAIAYSKQYNMPIVSLRPFGIYGSRQLGEGCLQIFIRKAINGEDIPVVGDGEQTRDWCYIDDFICAVEKTIENFDKANGQVINIGNPSTYCSISQLASEVIKNVNDKCKKIFIERNNVRDTRNRRSDISLARKLLDWEPKIGLSEGIIKTAEWHSKNKTLGEDISF
jgi:nucleoside-diphosphate-sugar epimerase